MSFAFKEVTVSGGNFDVEGTASAIDEITDVMVSAGWTIDDDRRSQPGSTSMTTTHKVVLVNDGGESGTDPNIYITLVSGTSASPGSDTVGFQVATAYDNVSHDVPASGIKIPNTNNPSFLSKKFDGDSNGYINMWIAADKDSVAVFTNSIGTRDQRVIVGKCIPFMDRDAEPYSVYLSNAGTFSATDSSVYAIVGNNPVQSIITSSDSSFSALTLTVSEEPRDGLGQDRHLYTGIPVLFSVDDTSPLLKGVLGYVDHIFTAVAQTVGLPRVGKMVVSGTGQEYIVFGQSTNSVFLRAS